MMAKRKSKTSKSRMSGGPGEFALNVIFNEAFLLKDVQEGFQDESVQSIRRIFDTLEKTQFILQGGDSTDFNEEAILLDTYANKPEIEKTQFRAFRFIYESEQAMLAHQKVLQGTEGVTTAEVDIIVETNMAPNDPEYTNLWGIQKINATEIWDCTEGCDTVIAIVDTGIDYTHPDLKGNMWEIYPGIHGLNYTSDNAGSIINPLDGNGHGTHVAGTAAAVGNNNYGVIGVAPKARLMAMKGLYNGGWGYVSDLANCIVQAANLGANVINNSWGSRNRYPYDSTLATAVNYADSLGAILVFAAGNSNDDAQFYYPQNDAKTLTVGATDQADNRASFSNYGPSVNVAAPGVDILSTFLGNTFSSFPGTSMAAPHVSGMVALILSKLPNLDFATVKSIVETFVVPITPDKYIGTGRINLKGLSDLLCNCQANICDIKTMLANYELLQEKAQKHHTILAANQSGACSLQNEECIPAKIPRIQPCFSLEWGDSPRDQFETHDTETVFITACNPYTNIAFRGLTITKITVTPNQILPNGEDSFDIVPSKLICYDHLAACACSTREYTFILRNAKPGLYTVAFEYCLDEILIEDDKIGKNQFEVELIDS